jgi:hypothetical protein
MIRIGNEYLDYDEIPHVVKQVKTSDTIDVAGDFSYSFSVPPTSNNKRLLNIGANRTDKLVNRRIECTIESFGNPIHIGYLRIESISKDIQLSFFSGNTEWFNSIDGKFIYEIDLSKFKLPLANTSPSAVVSGSWDNTEGIVYPLLDKGLLKNWSVDRLETSNFMPMVYVRDVMFAIFQQNGLKLSGEMLNDSLYNLLAAGIDEQFSNFPTYIEQRESFIGKSSPQTITTTPQLVTFTDENFPYFDGIIGNFSSSRYNADLDMSLLVQVTLELGASANYILELRRSGVTIDTVIATGDTVDVTFNSDNAVQIDDGEYFEVWMSTASGTVDIESGSVRFTLARFDATYPQFLFGNMTQSEFVTGIFRMLNVIASYDQFTKTVTANLFRNIKNSETDLSNYISEYEIDFTELLDDFGKRNIFRFQDPEDEEIENYNARTGVPYGAGVIEPESEFLEGDEDFDVPFYSSFSYYNERFNTQLMGLGIDEATLSGDALDIIDVTDDSGIAVFETSDDHNFKQLDYVWITSTNIGSYVGIGRISSVPTATTFKIANLQYVTVGVTTVTGSVTKVSISENHNGNIFIGVVLADMPLTDIAHRRTTINYAGTQYSNIAYFYFVKPNLDLPIDSFREMASFGNPIGNNYNGITLLDRNYQEHRGFMNDPTKAKAQFHLPLNVFKNIDQTKSVRIKTEDMNIQCFVPKIDGYQSSELHCEIDLIKLS